jgi:hypothetical protein
MNGEQQRNWEEKYYKPKTEYGFSIDGTDDAWFVIPKSIFEMVTGKFPGLVIKEKSFYILRRV